MCGVGKRNVAGNGDFPPFPSQYVPGRPHLTAVFVRDYWEHKPFILRELRATVSSHGLAVDHQRKVMKRTLGGGVVGQGGQTFTVCGDFGLVLGVYVVPDTALAWGKEAMAEVVERHEAAGVEPPRVLYMDCACCNGRPSFKPSGDLFLIACYSSMICQPLQERLERVLRLCGGHCLLSSWIRCISSCSWGGR